MPRTPGPWIEAVLPPRPPELVHDYLVHVGGDPSAYPGYLPPHFFPQWGFPLLARTLAGLPFRLVHTVNAGCSYEVTTKLPAHEPLHVRARLLRVDVDERRAILVQELVTGTETAPDALVAEVRALVSLGGRAGAKSDGRAARKERPVVPQAAMEVARLDIGKGAGLDFAKLTGDFNPIHWIEPYARVTGLPGCILHGFSTLARTVEALNRAAFAGDPSRLAKIDVRFTSPLSLPAHVFVFTLPTAGAGERTRTVYVGDAVGGRIYVEGHVTERAPLES